MVLGKKENNLSHSLGNKIGMHSMTLGSKKSFTNKTMMSMDEKQKPKHSDLEKYNQLNTHRHLTA